MGGREAYLRLLASHDLEEKSILPVLRPELMQPDGDKLARLTPLELLQVAALLEETSDKNTNDVPATLADELRTGFRKAGVTPPDGVYHGVFPTGLFNARVAPDGGDGLLILVESGAFELIEYVATLVTGPWSKDETVDRICRACSNYHASVDNVSPWLPDATRELDMARKPSWEQYRMAVLLTNAAEFFLLAHEWAHVILGHMADPAPRTVATPTGDLDVYERGRVQEHAADLLALRTIVRAATGSALGAATAGAQVFLGVALLLETLDEQNGRVADTHPPASDRIYMTNHLLGLEDLERDADLAWEIGDLFDDCHAAAFGSRPARPPFDRALSRRMREALDSFPPELGGDSPWSGLLDL